MAIRNTRLPTGLVLNLSGRDQSLTPEDHDLLREARVLRIDPSDSCNAACVFCESSFNFRGARLPTEVFAEAIASAAQSPHLEAVQFGCTFEPTIRKDFSRFGEILADTSFPRLPETISIVSNCWLLHRHDLEPFVRAGLNKLHVSLHSHTEEGFKAVMGHDKMADTANNLRDFKARFPHVTISAVCVINRLNADDPVGFARWAFHDVGVDYLRFTRASIVGNRINSPAKAALEATEDGSFELDDAAWSAFAAKASQVDAIGVDFLESRQNLKNSAMKVDALRLKRAGAPNERAALRRPSPEPTPKPVQRRGLARLSTLLDLRRRAR